MAATHTVNNKATVMSKYEGLPGCTGRQILSLRKQFGFIFGKPGCGKSHFLESAADSFVINVDRTSTSNPNPAATVWPILGDNGAPVDANGKSFILDWDKVLELFAQLIKLSEEKKPRPDFVVIDSLSAVIGLMQPWVPENMHASSKGKPWIELNGKQSWSFLYDSFLQQCMQLRNAGYGVWIVGHSKTIDLKNDEGNIVSSKDVSSFTDAFFQRMFPYFEIVAVMEKKRERVTTKVPYEQTVGTRVIQRERTETKEVTRYMLGSESKDLERYIKGRVEFQMDLPPLNGWAAFEDRMQLEQNRKLDAMLNDNTVTEKENSNA